MHRVHHQLKHEEEKKTVNTLPLMSLFKRSVSHFLLTLTLTLSLTLTLVHYRERCKSVEGNYVVLAQKQPGASSEDTNLPKCAVIRILLQAAVAFDTRMAVIRGKTESWLSAVGYTIYIPDNNAPCFWRLVCSLSAVGPPRPDVALYIIRHYQSLSRRSSF